MSKKITIAISLTIFLSVCLLFTKGLYWNVPLSFGLIGIIGIYLKSINDNYPYSKDTLSLLFLEILTVLMSISLICRYFYIDSTDWLTFIFIPIYVCFATLYLSTNKIKKIELKILTGLFLILIIPMLISNIKYGPSLINNFWENPYDDVKSVTIKLPFKYRNPNSKELVDLGFELRNQKRYNEAIVAFRKALEIEPKNSGIYFNLSETYAIIGNLEKAITIMDTSIMIDSSFAGSYNNRGLLYYKLINNPQAIVNYKKAIQLDSTIFTIHANLALTYHYTKEYDKACESIIKAVDLGLNIENEEILEKVLKNQCIKN